MWRRGNACDRLYVHCNGSSNAERYGNQDLRIPGLRAALHAADLLPEILRPALPVGGLGPPASAKLAPKEAG